MSKPLSTRARIGRMVEGVVDRLTEPSDAPRSVRIGLVVAIGVLGLLLGLALALL